MFILIACYCLMIKKKLFYNHISHKSIFNERYVKNGELGHIFKIENGGLSKVSILEK